MFSIVKYCLNCSVRQMRIFETILENVFILISNDTKAWIACCMDGLHEHCTIAHCTCTTALLHLALLHIAVPPEITPFTFPKLAEGARVQVACTVHRGDFPLNLTWLKNWEPLPSHVRIAPFDSYSSIVRMDNVRREDSGNYTCVASNSARVTTHTAHLIISGNLSCTLSYLT